MLKKYPARVGGESDSGTARSYWNRRLGDFLKELFYRSHEGDFSPLLMNGQVSEIPIYLCRDGLSKQSFVLSLYGLFASRTHFECN